MKIIKVSLFFTVLIVLSNFQIVAQSGRKDTQTSPTPSVNSTPEKESDNNIDKTELEKVRFLISGNLSRFAEEINKLGKLGYRVEKAFNFGSDFSKSQSFAAVLRLDFLDTFEYELLVSPNPDYLESRLNFRSENGFNPVQTFAVTACFDKSFENDNDASILIPDILKFNKGDIFVLERINGVKKKTKDYKVYTGEIGLGKSPSKELQNALDGSSKEYRPFKILFNKGGFVDFSVSIVLEDDLNKEEIQRTDYKFVKEVNGFEKEINSLAGAGYKFLSGRRIGLIKYALMAKTSNETYSYVFVDEKKYEKDFQKEVKSNFTYENLFKGDSDCDSPKTIGGKLVFEKALESKSNLPGYKFLKIKGDDTLELDNLLKDGFQILDVFYSEGFVVLLAK